MIRRGGEDWLLPDEAIAAIEKARNSGIALYGFDGGYLTDSATEPSMENSEDYSRGGYPNVSDPHGEAVKFIEARRDAGLHFTLVFAKTNSN